MCFVIVHTTKEPFSFNLEGQKTKKTTTKNKLAGWQSEQDQRTLQVYRNQSRCAKDIMGWLLMVIVLNVLLNARLFIKCAICETETEFECLTSTIKF